MRIGVIFAALVGFALAIWLAAAVGVHSIASAMFAVGWGGFVALCASGATLFVVLGAAWFALVPPHEKKRFANFVWGRAVRECAGELLPFSPLGGIVIGAPIVFVPGGLVFLLTGSRAVAASGPLTRSVGVGVGGACIGAALLFLVQQEGVAAIAGLIGRRVPRTGVWLGGLQQSLASI